MVEVRLYSILRELLGTDKIIASARRDESIESLITRIIGDALRRLENAGVNIVVLDDKGARVSLEEPIGERRVLHVMPPPSGGTKIMAGLLKPSDDSSEAVNRALRLLSSAAGSDSDVGAIALFVGVVRGINRNKRVKLLFYEAAGELSERKLIELAEWALSRDNIRGVVALHYTGPRRPGDVTMIVGVSGVGRDNVFPVLRELVDRIKHEVPIWKREERDEGVVYILGDREARREDILGD